MKKLLLICIAAIAVLASCNDYETYGDKKEKERNAISKFVSDYNIIVIDEDQFVLQGYTTDTVRNEFVKLNKSGVYMQIVRPGCGEKLKDGETANICCRFREFDIEGDTATFRNNVDIYSSTVDVMRVTNTSGTYSGSFTQGLMISAYSSASVPAGWLVPLAYIKIGRSKSLTDEKAKVRLIVPHSQGHTIAAQDVLPYFYEITYEKEA
ncbi:MAG: DUF4827 domain-containing protein [Prevotella sp.]|nr:DUF4827 domain-containing protein [Prevotella sp.]MBO7539293.1 DUF4827 domain-containing protein [Prevotella sp.]